MRKKKSLPHPASEYSIPYVAEIHVHVREAELQLAGLIISRRACSIYCRLQSTEYHSKVLNSNIYRSEFHIGLFEGLSSQFKMSAYIRFDIVTGLIRLPTNCQG